MPMTEREYELALARAYGSNHFWCVVKNGATLWCPYDRDLAPEEYAAWHQGLIDAEAQYEADRLINVTSYE